MINNKQHILIFLFGMVSLLQAFPQKSGPVKLDSYDRFINCLAFSNGGTLIAYSDANTIRVLNLETGSSAPLSKGRNARVLSLDISPDSSMVVSGGADNLIIVHDMTGRIVRILDYHSGKVTAVKFDNTGDLVYSGSTDKKVVCYNLREEKIVFEKEIHSNDILTIDISNDGNYLASGGADKRVCLMDAHTGELLSAGLNTGAWVRNVRFSSFNNTLNAVNDKGKLFSWTIPAGSDIRPLSKIRLSSFWVNGIDFFSNNNDMVYSTENGFVVANIFSNDYKYRFGKPVRACKVRPSSSPFFSIAVATWGKGIYLIDSRILVK
jgi:WD40 repeat protein